MLSVALCTFNGEQYLAEQIQSILDQSLAPDEIVICDDGSTDGTINIVERFTASAAVPIRLFVHETNVGVIRNFESALLRCEGDLIALADQDDVWLPDKLERSVAALRDASPSGDDVGPVVVHTDLRIVDAAKRTTAESFFEFQRIDPRPGDVLRDLLFENSVTGCTMLFNRDLLDRALPIPDSALMHDWWLALVAAASGRVVALTEPTILYRQHGGNAVGARRKAGRKSGSGLDRFRQQVERRLGQLEALTSRGEMDLPAASRDLIASTVRAMRRGGPLGAGSLYRRGIGMRSAKRTATLYLTTALGLYRRD